jgi:chaperonin GroEL
MLSNVLLKQASRRSAAAAAATVMAGSRRGFAKEIKFGVEGRAAMLRGVDVLADAVQVRTQKCVYV